MNRANLLLSSLCATLLAAPHSLAQPPKPLRDLGKGRIEAAPKHLIAEAAPAPRPAVIDKDNPWVEPGKVRWHESFEAAKKTAANSGKPVLLFQMMGRLDQQFT